MGNCCSRSKSSESVNPPDHGATPSSPPPVEPSLPTSGDPGPSSPPIDAIESIRGIYEKLDPVELIDPLVRLIKNQLHKMMNPSDVGSSSSEVWLATDREGIQHAATFINAISKEAEKVSESDAMKEMGRITLKILEGTGQLHQVLIGLSLGAFTAERYMSVRSTNECTELLLKILQLSKNVKLYGEQISNDLQMSDEKQKLCNAVVTIVEGAVIVCNYLNKEKVFRFWSATAAAAQLEKTDQQLKDVTDSVALFSLQRHWDKDVFLSHSGKQKNFVRQLYVDLNRENVSSFFDEDDNSLPIGQKFPRLIFKAAETCKIAVVVLSKEFILSKWPMLELSAFISAKKKGKNAKLEIITIFFKVNPGDLSHIIKDNPEWKKMEESDVRKSEWQDALKEVRSMKGLQLAEDGNEVDCRNKVVKKICCFLRGFKPPMLLEFKPVGIENQVEEVEALLDMKGKDLALAVTVYGFGGIGKSTLAASVVQSLDWSSMDFKFCRVAIDEKKPDKASHIINLQKHILYVLGGAEVVLEDTSEGQRKIKQVLENKCCLLLIDNVVDKVYIKDLLPQNLSFPWEQKTKLRIIITSRENNLNAELNMRKIIWKEYEVKCRSHAASKQLLMKTIVPSQVVENIYLFEEEEHMINEVAAECRGVPLLLSVFGKHLSVERTKDNYEEALDILRQGNLGIYRDEDLDTTLMFVYRKIKDVEVKEAFLDICIYFHGWKWNLVIDIVDSPQLKDLHRRALVSKSSSGEVIVHDILRFMGMKEARLTRFSDYKELSDALEDNLVGFENVRGISLLNDNRLITVKSLEAMHQSLRVLMLGDWVTLDGPPCRRAFRNLRFLRVGSAITVFPFEDSSKLDKLRVFLNMSKPGMNLSNLPSSLKHIHHEEPLNVNVHWDKFVKLPFQNLSSLKSFIVHTHKSVELPQELHLPASLVDLDLSTCQNLPKDIGHLAALESLILDRCDLERLPQGFGKLKKLKHLSMNNCSKLVFVSEELGMLSSLEALNMKSCENLRALPESLGGLLSLQTIEFSGCTNLEELPESFGELCIQSLNLYFLDKLNKLPNNFGNMTLLKDHTLHSCQSLMSLPNSFVQLKMLETLEIIKCTKLSLLPQDFGLLRCLKHMTVEHCHLLKELPHGFGALPALKTFTLRQCDSFVNLSKDFGESTSLEELNLEYLPLMSRIPDGFGKLKKLRVLCVWSCMQLETLSEDFENMASLERLTIWYSPQLEGAMMEKILKLPNCYSTEIEGSSKLLEQWEHMQDKTEHPIVVHRGWGLEEREREERRAIGAALLHGMCMEMNNATHQLMERSSLLVGLEEGTRATVALIMLPIQMQSHQHQTLQLFAEMARERAETNGSSKLQFVCARKVEFYAETPTPTEEEERAEEKSIRQILLSLPKGSCAISSTESKRVKLLTYCINTNADKLDIFVIGVEIQGSQIFENLKFTEYEISGNVQSQ